MLKNYFKMMFRSLWKNKSYSFLNIFGLAIGIACAGLIFLWVEDEVNFDSNNIKKERLYLIKTNAKVDNGIFTHSSSPGPLAQAMHTTIPGIANTCRTTEDGTSLLFTVGDKSMNATGKYAEASIFTMFSLPFLQGNPSEAFAQLHSIVLTEKAVKKFFGEEKNVIGKTVRMNHDQDFVVTGVLKDLPENASLQFEWLVPFQVWLNDNAWAEKWNNFGLTTYVELKPGVDIASINEKLLNPFYDFTTQKKETETSTDHVFLFGMKDWHLRNEFDNGKLTGGGKIAYVHLFTIIAWIILCIACINFMNLSTASSEKRSKEIGVRKVLGAGKRKLIFQFMGEAVFMAFIAGIVAIVLMSLVLPGFNLLVQKNLILGFDNPLHIVGLLLLTIICGMLAGSYPSIYLSSFNPVFILKGIKLKTGSSAVIRKGLVVAQFSISIILIIGTIIIYQQIQYVKARDIGYNKNNLLQIDAQGNMVKNFAAIKQDLINTGMVENAALADHTTLGAGNNTSSITWPGKAPDSRIVISQRLVSTEFMETTGMQILEGRNFLSTDVVAIGENRQAKDSNAIFHVIVTQSMEKLLGKGTAIGKRLEYPGNNGTLHMEVIGVVKDYVYGDMYGQSSPVVFYYMPEAANLLYVRTKAQHDTEAALAAIAGVLKKDNPGYPFEYKFVDDQFNELFKSEMLIGKLSRVFASLAIIISCLGLFGLAAYTAERRTKEIGVRKVLGASVSGIAALLSKDFIILVLVSCIVAFPVAYWAMHNWLQNYQYRVEISWWTFLLAGLLAITISLATISFQAIKAAVANPVKSLRTE